MNCPLRLYASAVNGNVQYYKPCECISMCELTKCKYMRCGFVIEIVCAGKKDSDLAYILSSSCGGSIPLISSVTGDAVTVKDLPSGTCWRVYISWTDSIPKGVVSGL